VPTQEEQRGSPLLRWQGWTQRWQPLPVNKKKREIVDF
jgi:hypothetical protein